ncbi:MAG: NTP transferase domain-containing protein [Oscillospiraceae bacterium]|jgi:molybdate transport system regulatory protein|nr:NTP transferase domain-containing protein [Oscillospiraceae bacterium]
MTAALIFDGPAGFDATEDIYGLSAIHRLVTVFKLADIDRVIISDSENMEKIMHLSSKLGADFLRLKKTDAAGAAGRVLATLKYLPERYSRLLTTPSNYPLVEQETLRQLCEVDAEIVIPTHGGERGYPVLISRNLFGRLADCGGDLAAFLAESGESITELETEDSGVITDVSVGADVSAIAASRTLHTDLRSGFKVTVAREKSFFGPGMLQLIDLVEETHAIRTARLIMGMSQNNLWHMTQAAEKNLGFKLFVHENDGSWGGTSTLTAECREFAEKYRQFNDDCERLIGESFQKYFS